MYDVQRRTSSFLLTVGLSVLTEIRSLLSFCYGGDSKRSMLRKQNGCIAVWLSTSDHFCFTSKPLSLLHITVNHIYIWFRFERFQKQYLPLTQKEVVIATMDHLLNIICKHHNLQIMKINRVSQHDSSETDSIRETHRRILRQAGR